MTMLAPNLTGVPETMLWTLHNRAVEAARPDGVLHDPEALRIYRALDYDFERSFGPGEPSHGVRSALFDRELHEFLARDQDGVIVNLGEGLETQRFRVPGARALWISVDLPAAIAVRERFIAPDAQHLHVAGSALDRRWFDAVPPGRAVYLTAQGLLIYLPPDGVARLFRELAARFPGAYFAFDTIPRWLSRRTLRGWHKTPHYRTPPMPWGVDRAAVAPTLRAWVPGLIEIVDLPFEFPRGLGRWLVPLVRATPWLGRFTPAVTRIRFPAAV
jgi:O-methyltransferase involved in polyketide biosynthesis